MVRAWLGKAPVIVYPGCTSVTRGWLADAAIGRRWMVIRLTIRRSLCADPAWKKRTPAEQVTGLTVCYARKTWPLSGMP